MNNSLTLSFGDWYGEVSPQFGMNLLKLSYKGKDVLRSPASSEAFAAEPFHFGTPLLLPANRTKGAVFNFQGEEFHLPLNEPQRGNHLHGLMHNAEFTVVEKTENTITAEYVNGGERYPFPFKLTITDVLNEEGYCRELKIANLGKKSMPYTLAYHTTFLENEISAPIKERYEVDENYIPTGNMLPLDSLEKEIFNSCNPQGKILSGSYTLNGNIARIGEFLYEFSENFDTLVLFNWGGDKGFICIEPQAGAVNGLNSEKCKVIKAGESETYIHRIEKINE